jgi:hypothetical protein
LVTSGLRVKAQDGFKFVAVENHVKQHISLPSFNYLDEAEDWVAKQEGIVEQAGYYTYAIYEVKITGKGQQIETARDY